MNEREPARRLHARVTGRVQGVGFRYFVQDNVRNMKITGWVRNRWDGTVEVVAEGDELILKTLLNRLRQGPPASFVTDVQSNWGEATGEFDRFTIRHTA